MTYPYRHSRAARRTVRRSPWLAARAAAWLALLAGSGASGQVGPVPTASATAFAPSPAFRAGLEAYRQQDPVRAAQLWRQAAQAGDVHAQTNLGLLYETGTGVTRDDLRALDWYRRAADAGFAHAQRQLGRYYDDAYCRTDAPAAAGITSEQKALSPVWYRKAAEQGDNEARYRLGRILVSGRCGLRDPAAGEQWLRAAAADGHQPSRQLLELSAATTGGVPPAPGQASAPQAGPSTRIE